MSDAVPIVDFEHFLGVEIRTGTIIEAALNPKARVPAYAMRIDFGDYGVKVSSAQITGNYSEEDLVGRRVAVVSDYITHEYLRARFPEIELIPVPNTLEALRLLSESTRRFKGARVYGALKSAESKVRRTKEGREADKLLKRETRAMPDFKKARQAEQANPDAPFAQLVIGATLHERGKKGAAKKAYIKFLKLCPGCRYASDIKAVMRSM